MRKLPSYCPCRPNPVTRKRRLWQVARRFLTLGCSKCHGDNAKGQIEWLNPEFLAELAATPEESRIQINYDAWGQPAPAADITARMLHGGRRPIDIYRRIYTGINGTPMPAFGEIPPDTIWHLVHYVMSIVEGGDPTANISADSIVPATDAKAAAPAESDADTDAETDAPAEDAADASQAGDADGASEAPAADEPTSNAAPADEAPAGEAPADAVPAEPATADSAATRLSLGLLSLRAV